MTTKHITTVRASKKINNLSIVILGGTILNRMNIHGCQPMFTIGNEYLINHQYNILSSYYKNSEIILATGFQADRIYRKINLPLKFIENQLHETTSSVEDLRLALNIIPESNSILVVPGDLYFDISAAEAMSSQNQSFLLIDKRDGVQNEAGVIFNDKYVESINFGLEPLWTGLFYIKEVDQLRTIITRRNNKLCMFEIIDKLIGRGVNFIPVCHNKALTIRMANNKILT